MATRIVLQGGDYLVVAGSVQEVTAALSANGGNGGFKTLGRSGEGIPDVVVNPVHVLYLEHFEEQTPFIDSLE